MDQSKKTMRHFYCRDVLWETFEQMANDFDCSIDYLVNEAMRYYARSKNYQSPGSPQMTGAAPVANNSGPTSYPPAAKAPNNRPPPGTSPPPNPNNTGGPTSSPARRPVPPTPGYAGGNRPNPAMNAGGHGMNGPSMQQHAPAVPAGMPAVAPQMGSAGPTLFLVYNGQRYPVTKDQFIIGRGSKTSDLPIRTATSRASTPP